MTGRSPWCHSSAGTSQRGLGAAWHCSGVPQCCPSELLHSWEQGREAAGMHWGTLADRQEEEQVREEFWVRRREERPFS